jgi:hypothetical protein
MDVRFIYGSLRGSDNTEIIQDVINIRRNINPTELNKTLILVGKFYDRNSNVFKKMLSVKNCGKSAK